MTRRSHWVRHNHQCRIPKRWITFDTEANTEKIEDAEVQTWRMGAAVRWRRDLKGGQHVERETFTDAKAFWRWVASFCRRGVRTCLMAHNLSYDVRISDAFNILPTLGYTLEWCNLDNNVSAMTWRSEHGTLVLCDLFTWIPKSIQDIGRLIGLDKLSMPKVRDADDAWQRYCLRDAEIVHVAIESILAWIEDNQLGNWQPTGAGFAYSMWRHKFMQHKILVHDNMDVIEDERRAMHTGRAEAWRHGHFSHDTWYEVDMRSAYIRIAAESNLPAKYKFSAGTLSQSQYEDLSQRYRVLCNVVVDTSLPIVPYYTGERTVWPVGRFETTLWDVEVNELYANSQSVKIKRAHLYTKEPVLESFARYCLGIQDGLVDGYDDVVRAFVKHGARALLGRLAIKAPQWEVYGGNPGGYTGISFEVDGRTGNVNRLMHIGERTLVETERREGRDSLPQITGWVMAECRVRLWQAMVYAGLDEVFHVDTDCVLASRTGLRALRDAYGDQFAYMWQVKKRMHSLIIYGPRNLRAGRDRKVAGVPKRAREVHPNEFVGERWRGLASDMAQGRPGAVTITRDTWNVKPKDPRRVGLPGVLGRTTAIRYPLD